MTSPGSPAEARSLIIERLVGDSGDAAQVIGAGRQMAQRALPAVQKVLSDELSVPVAIELKTVETGRVTDARADAGEILALTVVASQTSADALTMVMDAPAVAVMVSTMFGGDPDLPAAPIARDLSTLETEIASLVFDAIATALNGSGRRSLDLKLPAPRAMAGADARRRVLRDGAAVRIVFSISTSADRGTVTVMIPQRVLLAQRDGGAPAEQSQSEAWRSRFSEEVMRSSVTLEATMPLARLTLGQIASLQPGQIIEIDENAQSRAKLSARNKTLFVCEFGKLGQNYTVRIRHPFDAGQDLVEGLMPG